MDRNSTKLIVAFILGVIFFAGCFYMYVVIGVTKGVAPPKKTAKELPFQMGPWKGEIHKLQSHIIRATEANQVEDRLYTTSTGKQIACHMAVYSRFWLDVPHSPLVCYPSSGWTREKIEDVDLKTKNGTDLHVKLATFQRDGRQVFVVFWYQMGDVQFSDMTGLEAARKHCRNYTKWPSIIKVLLQVDATNAEQSRKQILDFAKQIFDWTSTMQEGSAQVASVQSVE